MSYYIDTSYASLNKEGEELCGDKVETESNDKETYLVLADGLGSGVKANILASLTSKIVITMLSQGAQINDIIETMASTLPICKEREVAYSTFTFLHVDVDGHARIVEYDNPETIILRNGKSMPLQRNRFEVQDKLISELYVDLKQGDCCVMMSDGVVHAGVGKLLNLGWQHKNVVEFLEKSFTKEASARSIQSLLLGACNSLYMDSPGDDTTVAVCQIRQPNVTHIMVGPPVSPGDDQRVFDLMMSGDTKIVCGGTTAQIVSRLANSDLRTELRYLTPNVPPIGYIDGIDLVTEGIITLGKALEVMRRYEASEAGRDNFLNSGKDGASLIAQTLINKATSVRFIVGRALNPAHQNPDMPLDLNIKLTLVHEIAACLQRLNKRVEIEYY